MKMKRIISALAALTMSVSCFAGLAITANAESEVLVDENFESYTAGNITSGNWAAITGAKVNNLTNDGSFAVSESNGNKFLSYKPGSGNGRSVVAALPIESGKTANRYQEVKYDFVLWRTYAGTDSNHQTAIQDSSGQTIFTIAVTEYLGSSASSTKLSFNGTQWSDFAYQKSYSNEPYTWYTIDAILDNTEHTIDYTVYATADGNKTAVASGKNVAYANTSASGAARLGMGDRANGPHYIDNIYVKNLEPPVISIEESDLTQEVSATTTSKDVPVTISNYSELTVTSSNEDAVTVSNYDNDNHKITLSYVANGVSTVTISATSADGITLTKAIEVTAGTVATHDITVKYVLADDHNTEIANADETTFAGKKEGSKITLSEIEDTITEKIYKDANGVADKANATVEYVYTGLDPATITAQNDYEVGEDDATIYAEYTAYDRWTYTINTKLDNEDAVPIKSGSGFAADEDKVDYTFSKYLTDANKKVTGTTTETSFSGSVTPTETGSKTIAYTSPTQEDNDKWFIEVEDAVPSNLTTESNAKLSGGKAKRGLQAATTGHNIFTVKENGVYTISSVGFKTNSNSTSGAYLFIGEAPETVTGDEDNLIANWSITETITKTSPLSTENVELHKGDVIYLKGYESNSTLDYILFEKTADLETTVSAIAEVATPIALTSVTGEVGAPTFETIEAFAAKYASTKQLKLVVTNPYEDTYPVVTIDGTDYELTEDDVTAVTENHVSTFYFEFAAENAEKLKEFGEITISYGTGEDKVDKTYDFNPATGD